MTNVADDLLEVLVQAGVTRVYGLVGDSLNAISDAVRRSGGAAKGRVDWVHVYNEEGAAFAASADAQRSGARPCHSDFQPSDRHGLFQEIKPEALFGQTSHYAETVAYPDEVVRVSRAAIQNAVGKQGAAVLVLPGAILFLGSDGAVPNSVAITDRPRPVPLEATIAALARRIGDAEKIAIFAGIGCAGARRKVLELAARLNAPDGIHAAGQGPHPVREPVRCWHDRVAGLWRVL